MHFFASFVISLLFPYVAEMYKCDNKCRKELEAYEFQRRIVGGTPVDINEIPYQVSLITNGVHYCGGSIIDSMVVVTAAHCFSRENQRPSEIRYGSSFIDSGGQVVKIKDFVVHSKFDHVTENMDNDIALVFLEEPIKFSNLASPIRLPLQNQQVVVGSIATVSGWGFTKQRSGSDFLKKAAVPIMSQQMCEYYYKTNKPYITNNMICAGYSEGRRDACQGDSGGPLVVNNILVGIVSWGEGCARKQNPGVYTAVSHFVNWVNAKIKEKRALNMINNKVTLYKLSS